MASPVSLGTLKTRVRELANMETNSGATDFVSDAELVRRINAALAQFYDKFVVAYPQEHYAYGKQFDIFAGLAEYDLPEDFYKLLHVAFIKDGIVHSPEIFQYPNMGYALQADLNGTANGLQDYQYRLHRNKLAISPTPRFVFTVVMQYIPTFQPLSADADTFDGVNGWEEWACLKAAIGCMEKEETDPTLLMAELSAQDARILKLVCDRDISQVERIIDVQGGREYRRRRQGRL